MRFTDRSGTSPAQDPGSSPPQKSRPGCRSTAPTTALPPEPGRGVLQVSKRLNENGFQGLLPRYLSLVNLRQISLPWSFVTRSPN